MARGLNWVDEKCTQIFSSKILKGRCPLQTLVTDGKIILILNIEYKVIFCSTLAQESSCLRCSCKQIINLWVQ
jgi:hypothetical protein